VSAAARGEAGALERLIEAFTPHISRTAAVYRNNPVVRRPELMQDGIVGLLRALERYDGTRGTPFWPYASWWVRQAMQQLVSEMTRQVVMSDRALRRLSRIKDARALWLRTQSREPTVRELMEVCACKREDIERLLAADMPSRGLEEPSGLTETGGEPLVERLADATSGDGYDRVVNRGPLDHLRERCEELSDRERHVVYSHYGMEGDPHTLREIASGLSLSVERVRQIEEAALDKLRRGLSGPDLHAVNPGDSPASFRDTLGRELVACGAGEPAAHDLVAAAHEMTAPVWMTGRAPRGIRIGCADGRVFCEVSDPAAGALSRAGVALMAALTGGIDRLGPRGSATFRLWAH
jgi:RNA polymerase sigma factor (sigma-70 family)